MTQLAAMIYANHKSENKDQPFFTEAWLNADTKDQARELGELFPEFVTVDTKGQYRRLYFRSYAADGVAEMVRRTDAFLAACAANGIAVDWYVRNPNTYYTAEEFDQHVRSN